MTPPTIPDDYLDTAPAEHLHRGERWAMLAWCRTGDESWYRVWQMLGHIAGRNAREAQRDERIRNAANALIGLVEDAADGPLWTIHPGQSSVMPEADVADLVAAAAALREALS